MKKTILTILIILFFISIYKDLTIGTTLSTNINQETTENNSKTSLFDVVKIKIVPGDTMLTVIERLNPEMNQINLELFIKDFTYLNPNVDPNKLQINRYYFFPQYK